VYDDNGNLMEGLKQGVHCILLLIDIFFDLLWKGISEKVRRYYGWKGIGKSFITDSVLA
jgi:hypothetical protein